MNQRNHTAQLQEIIDVLRSVKESLAVDEILSALRLNLERRTLLRRLAMLIQSGDIVREGRARATRYRVKAAPVSVDDADSTDKGSDRVSKVSAIGSGTVLAAGEDSPIVMSSAGAEIAVAVRLSLSSRPPVSYRRELLDSYVPNRSHYLPETTRKDLMKLGLTHGAT